MGHQPNEDAFARLPEEVLKIILAKVDVSHQHAVTSVCSRWRSMMSEGMFLLDLEIPALLLSKWLGSADDDDRGPGVHLDLTRHVKVVFSGPNDQQRRIAGRLPTVGPATAASAPSGSGNSPLEPQADVEVWTRVLDHNKEDLESALLSTTDGQVSTRRAKITLVGRLPSHIPLFSCDLTRSMAGSSATQRVPLHRYLRGASLRFVSGLRLISASGCSRLSWAMLPSSIEFAKLDGCANLRSLHRSHHPSEAPSGAAIHTLDVSYCKNLTPECLPQVCAASPSSSSSSAPQTTQNLSPMQNLHLSYLSQIPEALLSSLLQSCSSLSTVSLRGMATDAVVQSIAANCQELTGIDAAFSPLVHGEPLLELLARNPRVLKCNVRGCAHVSAKEYWDIAHQMRDRNLAAAVAAADDGCGGGK